MQIDSYEPQELATKGDRIQVSSPAGALAPVEPQPPAPRLFAVFGSEIRKRKRLLGFWLLLTAVVAGVVVVKVAKPVYRAEGKFKYTPNWRGGPHSPYTPPNIQTATQMLRSADVLEPVRQAHVPGMTKDEFGKAVRVEIVKQSEFVDVSFDHPDPAVAAAVADDLQKRALTHFDAVRRKALADAALQIESDFRHAGRELERAKDELRAASLAKGVADLTSEKKAVERATEEVEHQLRLAKEKLTSIKDQIKHQEALRDAPPDPKEPSIDQGQLTLIQAEITQLLADTQNRSAANEAKRLLLEATAEEQTLRPLYARGTITKADYDKVLQNIERYKDVIREWEDKDRKLTAARARFEQLKKNAGTRTIRPDIQARLDDLKREQASLPTTIANFERERKAQLDRKTEVLALEKELGPKIEEEELYRSRYKEFGQKLDVTRQSKDVNANDLLVEATPDVPTTPFSSNAPKLALAIAGASGLVFLGYIGLFALPQLSPTSSRALVPADKPTAGNLPRALIALVPYVRDSNSHAGTNGTLPEAAPKPTTAPEPEVRSEPVVPEFKVEAPEPGRAEPRERPDADTADIGPLTRLRSPEPVVAKVAPPPPPEPEPPVAVPVVAEPDPEPVVPVVAEAPPAPPPVEEPKPQPPVVAEPTPEARTESVEDFGSPVIPIPVRRPEPRIPVAPVALGQAAPPVVVEIPTKREPTIRVLDLAATKPILPLPPGLAPMSEMKPVAALAAVPSAKAAGPVRALAERIVEENVDRGGIVLFTPTIEQLRVTPVIGDLGKILTGRGDRVLVFDARPAAESPAWAGARVPSVSGFLSGQSAAGLDACFAPTVMKGVEYSRGDLSGKIDGVMSAHRFRQLVEEMQERYSLVLMVSPPVTLDGTEPVLANLAEGMVLVTESTAATADVHAFIESLSKRVAAPLYGTLTVPRA